MILIPALGGLVIGLMARYGSEKIRGHGIPEALEPILFGRSRMSPKVALLKPLSSAISIGTGGPFGAEGPIIMTGGAFGSLFAQFFNLSSAERKILLVAGAAGGMSAIFAAPIAAVLLAVELLLFEWRPRSFIPVALGRRGRRCRAAPGIGAHFSVASSCATGRRGTGFCGRRRPACRTGRRRADIPGLCLRRPFCQAADPLDVVAGHRRAVRRRRRLDQPGRLGVGYDTIHALLQGNLVGRRWSSLLIVKATIWSLSLGSGTSGGVLAPLLMIGGA